MFPLTRKPRFFIVWPFFQNLRKGSTRYSEQRLIHDAICNLNQPRQKKSILMTLLKGGLITVGILALTTFSVRVPPPSRSAVEEIVGKNPLQLKANENAFVVRSVAHRGAGLDAPENTLEAFKYCADKGMNFIELDVHLTKDKVPIVFHDDNMERMTNDKFRINDTLYSDLKQLDLSVKHPFQDRFKGAYVPTLDETVQQLLKQNQRMFLDIKHYNFAMVQIILDLFKKYDQLHERAVVTSFYPNLIYLIRKSDPKIVCSLAWRPYAFQNQSYVYPSGPGPYRSPNIFFQYLLAFLDQLHTWMLPKITYYILGISLILLHKDCISGETILSWHDKGVRVMAWTVNHPVEKQYYSKVLKVTYLTDTLTGENTAHSS